MERRILLLLTDLEIGGTPTVVREIARRLHRPPNVSIHVACLGRRGPVAEQITGAGIPVIPVTALDARKILDVKVVYQLIQLIRSEQFDTVLSFLVHANVAAAVSSFFCPGVRFLQSIQTTQLHPRWHWFAQRLAAHRADRIVVPSPSVADVAHDRSGVPNEKIAVIPNGVDLPHERPPLKFGQPPHRVVFIGRLDPVKRLPDLLQAVKLLNGFVHLDVYGDGIERSKLVRLIDNLQIATLVTLHGSIDGPQQALCDAELLVLPSEAEGFGLVLIEAMAVGVPVVATDAPGIRDVVKNGITGLLSPIGSAEAMANAMRKVLEDHTLAQSLAAAAWIEVRKRFTWELAVEQYNRLLQI